MKIHGKSVRSATKLRTLCIGLKNIRLIYPCDETSGEVRSKTGFPSPNKIGDAVIPLPTGKISSFNVNGLEKKRTDLPLEPQAVTSLTSWKDWHGKEHSGLVTRTRMMYPIEYIPAPSEFIEIISINEKLYYSTREVNLNESDATIIHLENLMLELFSQFEVFDAENGKLLTTKIKRMMWEILPPGQYPWDRIESVIKLSNRNISESDEARIHERLKYLKKFTPTFIGAGRAGFNGYFVYAYEDKETYILESIFLNNATYIFNSNWEELSQLTKNEIINGEHYHRRIIHDKNWKRNVNSLMLS
ncbi:MULTISPECIES: hypothetical protein [Pantoea]|uniref:hypothetical protein n=1 Tax=Pantoea TaxID=53335 RepID=UPI001981D6FC|nr:MULTISPECIES: hypothetical protein [Pantoea]